jgi:hypothetical protein
MIVFQKPPCVDSFATSIICVSPRPCNRSQRYKQQSTYLLQAAMRATVIDRGFEPMTHTFVFLTLSMNHNDFFWSRSTNPPLKCKYLNRLPRLARFGAMASANALGYSSSKTGSPAVVVMDLAISVLNCCDPKNNTKYTHQNRPSL